MATIQVPDPDQPWKVGDLVTVHLRVGGVNANDYVLEAADVTRADDVAQIHLEYQRQLKEKDSNVQRLQDEQAQHLQRLNDEHAAQVAAAVSAVEARDKTIEQLQAALAKPVGGPVITSAGVT